MIAKENDFRLCLNKDVIKFFRYFFADIILLSFVVAIQPNEIVDIYQDKEF